MKTLAISLLLLAIVPLEARAIDTYDRGDVLSYVAMPLAVSAVCDLRGVQTDRVGELVTYMNQANVAPTDFVDVFRYVPVALVMRTDNRPDFVEWVHGEVGRGVMGGELVTAMEGQLRAYDDYVPVSTHRSHRRYTRDEYAYAYEPDYVPVVIRRHCERLIVDPLSLIEMPVAVTNVCDLGLPYDRVSSLVVELNLGDVPPLQFVELMRYAPVALDVSDGYRGQPDFVQFVRTERLGGARDYRLVRSLDQHLRVYDVAPQIDLSSTTDVNQVAYVPAPVRNYVDPVNPGYVPAVVHTRMAANFAARRASGFNQSAPAIVAAPQVQRLLSSPNRPGIVTNPGQARRELARENRLQREAPVALAPTAVAPPVGNHGRIENRGRVAIARPAIPVPRVESAHRGNGNGRGREHMVPAALPPPIISSAPPALTHGRGHNGPPPAAFAAPAVAPTPRGRKGHVSPSAVALPGIVPAQPHEHLRSHAGPPPVAVVPPGAIPASPHDRGRGHAGPPPVAVATPAAIPTSPHDRGRGHVVAAPPAAAQAPAPASPPPGQEKKKGKGKD